MPVAAVSRCGEPLLVALLDFGAQQGDAVDGLGKPVERSAKDGLKRFAFAGAHDLQLPEQRHDLLLHAFGESGGSSSVLPRLSFCSAPGQAQHGVEVGLAARVRARRAPR